MGQLLESVVAKGASISGRLATADLDSEKTPSCYVKELKELGLQTNGCEHFYNPFTGMTGCSSVVRVLVLSVILVGGTVGCLGMPFEGKLFVGIVFMERLHHNVRDKIHSRGTGPKHRLTRQPVQGKKHHG